VVVGDSFDNYPVVRLDWMWHQDNWIGKQIRIVVPGYRWDYSKTIRESYWMNHCERCGAKLGDWFIMLDTQEVKCAIPEKNWPMERRTLEKRILRP
jgi:hypothetical protein